MYENNWTDNIYFNRKTCLNKDNEFFEIDYKSISVYVVLTHNCNVNCKFCAYRGQHKQFNLSTFKKIYKELSSIAEVDTVHFTGGEPTLELENLIKICEFVKGINDQTKTSVNTNGTRLKALENIDTLDNIALSRHHYEDKKNEFLFSSPLVPSAKVINDFKEKEKLHLSCNLIKGFIDSKYEIESYLNFVAGLNVNDIGLVSLMPVNDFCSDNFVNFLDCDINSIKNLTNTRFYRKIENNCLLCRCDNYLYMAKNGNLLSVYHRHAIKNNCIADYLVFDDEHIKQGFGGKILV